MTRIMTVALLAVALGAAAVDAQAPERPASAKASAAAAVNLNTATLAQLEALPGIGTKTAERIVEYRQKNGGFKKIEELMNVRGVWKKSFVKMKPLISVTVSRGEHTTQ